MEETILQRINHLERMILVHSYIYYRKSSSIWDDFTYDDHCKELAKLLRENPSIAEDAEWAWAFQDYDGSTGFNLPLDSPWVYQKGEYLYRIHNNPNKISSETAEESLHKETKKNIKPVKANPVKWTAKQKKLW